jgi:hypothetical protein
MLSTAISSAYCQAGIGDANPLACRPNCAFVENKLFSLTQINSQYIKQLNNFLWNWIKKRHNQKSLLWIFNKYCLNINFYLQRKKQFFKSKSLKDLKISARYLGNTDPARCMSIRSASGAYAGGLILWRSHPASLPVCKPSVLQEDWHSPRQLAMLIARLGLAMPILLQSQPGNKHKTLSYAYCLGLYQSYAYAYCCGLCHVGKIFCLYLQAISYHLRLRGILAPDD